MLYLGLLFRFPLASTGRSASSLRRLCFARLRPLVIIVSFSVDIHWSLRKLAPSAMLRSPPPASGYFVSFYVDIHWSLRKLAPSAMLSSPPSASDYFVSFSVDIHWSLRKLAP